MAKRRARGEGGIYKRKDGRWQTEYLIGRDSKGERLRKFVTGKTQREVREKLDELKRQHAAGQLTNSNLALQEYLREWLSFKLKDLKPRTIELYNHYIQTHIIPRLGRIKLKDLKPIHVQQMVNEIADAVSTSSANRSRALLFGALKQAVRLELIMRNPVEAVDPFKEKRPQMRLWEAEDAIQFLESAKTERLYTAFLLLVCTGLRRGELLGLRWKDINDGLLSITQAVHVVGNRAVISEPKTEQGERLVAVAPDIIEALAAHKVRQDAEVEHLGRIWQDHDLVFASERGTPMHPRNFSRTWYRLQERAEVPRVRLHDLRHFHISQLINKGFDPVTVADRVGHKDPGFTLRRYSHMFKKQRMKAAFGIKDLLEDADPEKKAG